MRLYRLGDTGRPVLDIQDRLRSLDHDCPADPAGEFGNDTQRAVTEFQESRGLARDGIVGPDTWRALVEAGYRLGDRLLWLRRPMFRGEDVDELQRQLNALGFDAGKVDGIFGPDTQRAVIDFQQNRRMAEDGIAGPEVIRELKGVARSVQRQGLAELQDLEWLHRLPDSVVGARIFLDAASEDAEEAEASWEAAMAAAVALQAQGGIPMLSRSSDARFPSRVRARRANRSGAELVISFQKPHDDVEGVFFFASERSRSEAGAALAAAVGHELGLPAEGRAPVMLKETRAPAVIVCVKELEAETGQRASAGVVTFFQDGQEAFSDPNR